MKSSAFSQLGTWILLPRAFAREYFARPLEDKLRDMRQEVDVFDICGYKPMCLDPGNVQGKQDGCQGLRISTDLCSDVKNNKSFRVPPGLEADWLKLKKFSIKSRNVTQHVLEILSDTMGLEKDMRFEKFHDPEEPSSSVTALQYYPFERDLDPNLSVWHFTHTDTGSVTILFTTEWGLQVPSPISERWEWVEPRPEHAIVNIGDTLRFLSNQQLKSSLHRIVPCREKWTFGPRYSLVYFLRANDRTEFVDASGRHWFGDEWLTRKLQSYREPHTLQSQNTISTGRINFLGLWSGCLTEDTSIDMGKTKVDRSYRLS